LLPEIIAKQKSSNAIIIKPIIAVLAEYGFVDKNAKQYLKGSGSNALKIFS
jgi:hypothetical protein